MRNRSQLLSVILVGFSLLFMGCGNSVQETKDQTGKASGREKKSNVSPRKTQPPMGTKIQPPKVMSEYGGKPLKMWVAQLEDKVLEKREEAAQVLGKMKNPEAVPALVKAFDSSERMVQVGAMEALIKIGKPSLPALIKAIFDDNREIRWCAASALISIKDPSNIPHLIKALKDEYYVVRQKVAAALYIYGDESAVPALVEALKDPHKWGGRDNAAKALSRITKQRGFGSDYDKWNEWLLKNKKK